MPRQPARSFAHVGAVRKALLTAVARWCYLAAMRKYHLSKSDDRVELDARDILTNDVNVPGVYNPHGVALWLIQGPYGLAAAVWASNEQDALDEAVDADLLNGIALDEDDAEDRTDSDGNEDFARLGNASEPFDLDNVRMHKIPWKDLPEETQHAFLMSRDEGFDNLDEYDGWVADGGEEDEDEDEDEEA